MARCVSAQNTVVRMDILKSAVITVVRQPAIAVTTNSAVLAKNNVVLLINAAQSKLLVVPVQRKRPVAIKMKWLAAVTNTDA